MELQTLERESAPLVVNDQPDEINLLDLLILLAQHKMLIMRTTLIAAAIATTVSFLIPNRYTAVTNILPPQQNQSLASSLMGQLGALGPMAAMAQGSLGLKNPADLYVGMLKSRSVEDALIQQFGLMDVYRDKRMSDTRKDLEGHSTIELGKEGMISISVEDKDPKRAADIANGYVEGLRRVTQRLAVTEAGQRRLFFEQELEQAKNNLANAEQAMKKTQETTGIIQLDGQAKAIIESVVVLKAQIAAKEVQLRAMRSFATEQNPDLILTEQQLAGMKAQLASLQRQSGGGDGDIQVATGKVPEAGLEYVRKLRDVKYYETIFELLAKQYEAAKLDEAKNAAVIQIVDPAVKPDQKSSPKRSLIVVVAFVLGFSGSICWVLLAEGLKRVTQDAAKLASLQMLRELLRGTANRA